MVIVMMMMMMMLMMTGAKIAFSKSGAANVIGCCTTSKSGTAWVDR